MQRNTVKPLPAIHRGRHAKIAFDYKEPELLKRYMTEHGYILSRERTGLTSKEQRELGNAVKRARHVALIPFVTTL
ncbi:MAG TPA: 30S ribosomal protein S18 [Patescibacteria group bacterium]|nr:30S ribosomal protein S18 [Patescibacteria group bacterium]